MSAGWFDSPRMTHYFAADKERSLCNRSSRKTCRTPTKKNVVMERATGEGICSLCKRFYNRDNPWPLRYGYIYTDQIRHGEWQWLEVLDPHPVFWTPNLCCGMLHRGAPGIYSGLLTFRRDELQFIAPPSSGLKPTSGICECWHCSTHREDGRPDTPQEEIHRGGLDCGPLPPNFEQLGIWRCPDCGTAWCTREWSKKHDRIAIRA